MRILARLIPVFVILAPLLSAAPVAACSCQWAGPFAEVMNDEEFVVRARVIAYGEALPRNENIHLDMRVELLETWKGDADVSELTILGDPGNLCRVYITEERFKIGEEYLFAVTRDESGDAPLNICGEYWMRIDGDSAAGQRFSPEEGFVEYRQPLDAICEAVTTEP